MPPATIRLRPAPAVLLLDARTVRVLAGGLGSLHGLVLDQTGAVEDYDVRVGGLPAAWSGVAFGPADAHQQPFELGLMPPRSSKATARAWPFKVELVSRETGRVAARSNATLIVEPLAP